MDHYDTLNAVGSLHTIVKKNRLIAFGVDIDIGKL